MLGRGRAWLSSQAPDGPPPPSPPPTHSQSSASSSPSLASHQVPFCSIHTFPLILGPQPPPCAACTICSACFPKLQFLCGPPEPLGVLRLLRPCDLATPSLSRTPAVCLAAVADFQPSTFQDLHTSTCSSSRPWKLSSNLVSWTCTPRPSSPTADMQDKTSLFLS